jgi:hypothetical protein
MHSELFTLHNPKTVKGEKAGYMTFIMHLAPADRSGHEVCQWRTRGCTALCLNTAGRGGIRYANGRVNPIQEARTRRTRLFFADRSAFMALLVSEIERACAYARSRDLTPVFRLNGTSDIVWESLPLSRQGVNYAHVFAAFPDVQFYDYTKAPYSARAHDIPNYHLTFSYAETLANQLQAREWYARGHNVSVVFGVRKAEALPRSFRGAPVFDADGSDLRFLDPRGIAGLHAKGNAWQRPEAAGNEFIVRASKRS